MLLGLAAGKIGDLVFYRDGGEQRTRTRVVPKNPRSQAQMAQRVRIANVSATYRMLKSVLADSFTGRPSNQSGYNAFASGAIEISPYLTREFALADVCIPAPYVVARGTIAPVPFNIVFDDPRSNLTLRVSGLEEAPITIGEVSNLLLQTYPQLQQGDVLTFIGIGYAEAIVGEFGAGYRGTPVVESFKIDTASTENMPSYRFYAATNTLNFTITDVATMAAGAIVVSRTDGNGSLQVSFAQLVLSEAARDAYSDNRTDNALYAATESYKVGESSILRE